VYSGKQSCPRSSQSLSSNLLIHVKCLPVLQASHIGKCHTQVSLLLVCVKLYILRGFIRTLPPIYIMHFGHIHTLYYSFLYRHSLYFFHFSFYLSRRPLTFMIMTSLFCCVVLPCNFHKWHIMILVFVGLACFNYHDYLQFCPFSKK
jgi:hypothetical protein